MGNFKFAFGEKTYELSADDCRELINDETEPVTGIDVAAILELLSQHGAIDFERAYFDQPCPKCLAGKAAKAKYFNFLEYHFSILTKHNQYVIASLSADYPETSYEKLLKLGTVDNSYYVSVIVCENCGDYNVEIAQCDL